MQQTVNVLHIDDVDSEGFAEVRGWFDGAERIGFLTGAGISTESGIPDFRGPDGLWMRDPEAEKAAHIDHYVGDAEIRRRAWQGRIRNLGGEPPQPNTGHHALVHVERTARMRGIITQNVDGLHQMAGNSSELVHEIHGSWRESRCWTCGDTRPMREAVQRAVDGDPDPSCLLCGGILKSTTVLFGESLVPQVVERCRAVADDCDLFVAIGTSLSVSPANQMLLRAHNAGSRVVIVNDRETALDRYAQALVRGRIGIVVPALVGFDPGS
jgi:NAD-dependent deacetylase